MKRRNWDTKTKTKIVLEGLSGRSVSEICSDHGIQHTQYYRWRDQFMNEAHKVFDLDKDGSEVERLRRQRKTMNSATGLS